MPPGSIVPLARAWLFGSKALGLFSLVTSACGGPGTVPSTVTVCDGTESFQQPCKMNTVITPILQMRKLSLELKIRLVQGHRGA